jgi:serine/threonine-protein phosphatase 2A regulatory subunit B''
MPLVRSVINTHPGLEFLKETPEFQDRYQETVIHRIFYHVNVADSGRISCREWTRSDVLDVMTELDEEDDINKILRYFSYEHFYVVYCKFWELDTDHDFQIDREDLLRYGNNALTFRVVDQIFAQVPRPFKCPVPGRMGYEDFCWFIFSEEDKTTDVALHYWFRCMDLDCDGRITRHDLSYYFDEQSTRMESLMNEPVLFDDLVCQLHDMLHPETEGVFTMRDMKRERWLSGILFNCMFNINKFILFETRDPFLARNNVDADGNRVSPWDKFAQQEYMRLASEEDEGGHGGNHEGLDSFDGDF